MRFFSCLLFVLSLSLAAQTPVAPAAAEATELDLFGARPGETELARRLAGLRIVASEDQLAEPGFPADTLDTSRVGWLGEDFAELAAVFADRPVSRESLDRLVLATRTYARGRGRSFVAVYLPPQDITGGYVQLVVREAVVDAPVVVRGAKYFSEAGYLRALDQPIGGPVDEVRIRQQVERLNRNPFRHAVLAAEAGAEGGTTRLILRVEERRPWQFSAGYDNTGTRATGENRATLGVLWGNAFGRGDQLNYRFSGDPRAEHSRSHVLSYATELPSRHALSVFGAWSDIESIMPAPFTQRGSSGQAGVRYAMPLRKVRRGWTENLTLGADFKYSDNTLEFATLPVTDNATHVVQAGATYAFSFAGERQHYGASLTLQASPGGLTERNRGRYFDVSRPGAKASYVYGRMDAQYSRALPRGLRWMSSASLQLASRALLGSEQLNGGGSSGVRGYRESSAFGDWGVVVNNELHAPAVVVLKGRDLLDVFAFVDLASLNLNVDDESTDLRSAGLGVNYSLGRHFSVRASYGWQMKRLDNSLESSRGHVSANVSF